MRKIFFLALLPAIAGAQEVQPVISHDYLSLIQKDVNSMPQDTMNNMQTAVLIYEGIPRKPGLITVAGNQITIQGHQPEYITVTGNYHISTFITKANRIPRLQNQYVQGLPANGAPAWTGPETGIPYSYGPHISTLEFDGTPYAYDYNGMLVPKGTGTGMPAVAYDNVILRPGFSHTSSLQIETAYTKEMTKRVASAFTISHSNEKTIIPHNSNKLNYLHGSVKTSHRNSSATASYQRHASYFSNSNRSGFLSRIYQHALLTPVSFSNSRGTELPQGQRSFSNQFDNPLFLLNNPANGFENIINTGSLTLEKKGVVSAMLTQSFEHQHQVSRENFKPWTAHFPAGLHLQRNQTGGLYTLHARGVCNYHLWDMASSAEIQYILRDQLVRIAYDPSHQYRYQRTSQEASLKFDPRFRMGKIFADIRLENRIYTSGTANRSDFFLPSAKLHMQYRYSPLFISAGAGYSHFMNELSPDQSHSHAIYLQHTPGMLDKILPSGEVAGFGGLMPVHRTEWNAFASISYRGRLSLKGSLFSRKTRNDVFAMNANGQPVLLNMADHLHQGAEVELAFAFLRNSFFTTSHELLYFTFRNTVTRVEPGFNHMPLAGFSNIHKSLIEGAPLGVVTGRKFLRDDAGRVIIGSDGFPLEAPELGIIANPNPDFIIKLKNHAQYRGFNLSVDWEWKNGGKIWNGTQAVLDYYGRSAASGELRSTTGYIFQGVDEAGHPNTIPVSFYDPSLPVDQNRWTRYGHGGIHEEYVQKADYLKIHNLVLGYNIHAKKFLSEIKISLFIHNILIWTPYEGDPGQLFMDLPNSDGLDYFNLPSLRSFGINVNLQF